MVSTRVISQVRRNVFSLVEMLVVIAILAVLMSLLTPSLGGMMLTAKNTQCMNQLKSIHLVWELYADDFQYYPDYGTPRPNAQNFLDAARKSSFWLSSTQRDPGNPTHDAYRYPFDLRPHIRSYMGPLNDTMICPLASSEWFQEPHFQNRYDIDGLRMYSNQNWSESSYMLYPSSHSKNYWLDTSTQLRMPGDTFECSRGPATGKSFSLLASDYLFADNQGVLYTTQGPYDSPGDTGGGSNNRPRAYTFNYGEETTANFLDGDGSVRSYEGVHRFSYENENEWILTYYGDRGWMLPADLQSR